MQVMLGLGINVLNQFPSLAAFQRIIFGWVWVITEGAYKHTNQSASAEGHGRRPFEAIAVWSNRLDRSPATTLAQLTILSPNSSLNSGVRNVCIRYGIII
jgi:hypothetical protein